jgi:hypothetical protein
MDRAARFELARSFGNKQEISGSNGCGTRYLMLSRRDRRKSIPKIGSTGANRNAQSRKGFWKSAQRNRIQITGIRVSGIILKKPVSRGSSL